MRKPKNNWILIVCLASMLAQPVGAEDSEVKEVDLSLLKDRGALMRVLTDGRPIWVAYRTKEAMAKILMRAHIEYPNDPPSINPLFRSVNINYFVVFGGCPSGEELPRYYPEEGFVCDSNCASFDMAGRPSNDCGGTKPMDIPIHHYKDEKTIVIPIHQDGGT